MSVTNAVQSHVEKENSGLSGQWKLCLNQIKSEVPAQTYQTWFLPIIPVSLVDNELILRVPSSFFFEWIESHYLDLLRRSAAQIFGTKVELQFLVASKSPANSSPGGENEDARDGEPETTETLLQTDGNELEPTFTFENYFAGTENLLARRAAEHVVNNLGKAGFNPLMIYGATGTGKTHLLNAIGNLLLEKRKNRRLVLMGSERFLHEYIYNLQSGNINKYKRKLLQNSVILFDDLQFLSNKIKSQEFLLFIFQELLRRHKQIIITSNLAPGRLTQFNPKLISFMQKGLIVDLVNPQCDTREDIIDYHLQRNGIELEPEIKRFLIDCLTGDMHVLNAAMTRIIAQISLLGKPLTLKDAEFIVAQIYPQWRGAKISGQTVKSLNLEKINDSVSRFFNVPLDILLGSSRKKEVILARQVAIFLCRELTSESLARIGYHFGNRHHASVLYAYHKIRKEIDQNPVLRSSVNQIRDQLL